MVFLSDTLKFYFIYDKKHKLEWVVFRVCRFRRVINTPSRSEVILTRPTNEITFKVKIGKYRYRELVDEINYLYQGGTAVPSLRSLTSLLVDQHLSLLTLGLGYPLSIYVSGLIHHGPITRPISVEMVRRVERLEWPWLTSLFSPDSWLTSLIIPWGMEDSVWITSDEEDG